jgi:hypothetical protein
LDRSVVAIESVAAVGRVATVMARLSARLDSDEPLSVFGLTMSVLYGHTVLTAVVDAQHATAYTTEALVRANVQPGVPIVERSNEASSSFWVSWCFAEGVGAAARVIDSLYDMFSAQDADVPNIQYAMTRVLSDGFSCAGKIRFLGSREAVRALGFEDAGADGFFRHAPDTERKLAARLDNFIADWNPPVASWKIRPIWVTESEPREEPWATLVAPEGTYAEGTMTR